MSTPRVCFVTGASGGIGRAVAVALAEAVAGGRIKEGDLVMLSGFGAGMTWGTVLIRWGGVRA